MLSRKVVLKEDNFDMAYTPTTTPVPPWGWTLKKTAAAGSPALACVSEDDGCMDFLLEATSEAQILDLFQNDVVNFRWDMLQYASFLVQQAVAADAVTTLFFGLTNARNDAVGSVTRKAIFKVLGSTDTTAVVIDTADGTTTNTNIATGQVVGATYVEYLIDFTQGLGDVRFYINGARVAASTTFSLAALAGANRCQVNMQLQKASGTGVPESRLSKVAVQYRTADGA